MKHWDSDSNFPGTWGYRTYKDDYKIQTTRKHSFGQDPEDLFCSIDCFRKYHNGKQGED